MNKSSKYSRALLLLSTAAIALPAIEAEAATVAESPEIGVRYHSYQEKSIDNNLVRSDQTSLERYTIDVNQFMLIVPLSDSFDVNVNYQHETLSGASPWYTTKNENGEVIQVMSGATISEQRDDFSIKVRHVTGSTSTGFTYAQSTENDYDSESVGLDFSYESEDKLTTYSISGGFSDDVITPTDTENYELRPIEEFKESWSIYTGLSQIINKDLIVGFGVSYTNKEGYLSDPYKQVSTPAPLGFIGDSRPDERNAYTFSARARQYINPINGALHIDYRYFSDDWEIESQTINLAWYQNITTNVQLVPFVRLYTQSAAFYYEPFYDEHRQDGYYSTDYRLSAYGAVTLGMKLNVAFEHWSFTVSYEDYRSNNKWGTDYSQVANPGLVNFSLFDVGMNYKF
jgi:hypothetical protein